MSRLDAFLSNPKAKRALLGYPLPASPAAGPVEPLTASDPVKPLTITPDAPKARAKPAKKA
jgi:hypothetical protein